MASLRFLERLRMNPREQRLASVLLVVLGVLVVMGIPIAVEGLVLSRRSEAEKLRAAVEMVQAARPQIRDREAKREAAASRYARPAPTALAGYLDKTARAQKLDVTDSVDRPEVPQGKRYVERSTVVHFKKAGMASIAKFLETVEREDYAAVVSRLDLRKRTGEPDSYDVELGVSAYDRKETGKETPADKAKGDKPDTGDKGRTP